MRKETRKTVKKVLETRGRPKVIRQGHRLCINIEEDLHKKITQEAKKNSRSINGMIRYVIQQYITAITEIKRVEEIVRR